MARVILKHGRAMPFVYRHPWVFSGAIKRIDGRCTDGDVVEVVGDRGDFIGRGLYNAASQITVRLISWREDEPIDDGFFRQRISEAVALRERLVPLTESQSARRLVFGEADGLPGLVVDQYAGWLVAQFLSLGLDRRREVLLDALESSLHPAGIFERSDADVREKEGLEKRTGAVRGSEPPAQLAIRDGGLLFEIDVRSGQKTGHYLDQRENRAAAARLAAGRSVLDAFCYSGGFGLAAARHGAARVTCLDSSRPALDLVARNAALNGCSGIEIVLGDAAGFLRDSAGGPFGLIVLDPPGFAKSSYDVDGALASYADLYGAAMRRLEPGGILVACCCSQHIRAEHVVRTLNAAGVAADRSVRILESRGQPPDHPVAANCPETAYLKCLICWVE